MPNFPKRGGDVVSVGMRTGSVATPTDSGARTLPKPSPPVTGPKKVGNHPPTGKWDPSKWGKGGGDKKPQPKPKPKPKPKTPKTHQPPWWTYLLGSLNNGNSGVGGDQGLGSLGAPTIIPATPSSGGGVSIPLVIGGVSVLGALLLLVYEWWRHKHAKEEAGRA